MADNWAAEINGNEDEDEAVRIAIALSLSQAPPEKQSSPHVIDLTQDGVGSNGKYLPTL